MAGNKFSPGGLNGFLAFHAEKVVLGLCVALVALFFCLGWGVGVLPEEQTPGELFSYIKQAERHIEADTWDDIRPSRAVELNHLDRAVASRKPIQEDAYELDQYWKRPNSRPNERRIDPEVYRPEKVLADPFVLAMGYRLPAGRVDPIGALPEAMLDPPPEVKAPPPKKPKRENNEEDPANIDDPDGIDADPIDPEGDDPGFVPPNRKALSPTQLEEILKETRRVKQAQGLFTRGATVVAIRAIVPYKRQREEFERCFGTAMSFSARRDQPEYFFIVGERAEVPDTGPVDDSKLKWELVTNTIEEQKWNEYWSFVQEELVDRKYLNPAIASRVPNALLAPAEELASHPHIVKQMFEAREREKSAAATAPKPAATTTPPGAPGAIAPGPGSVPVAPMPKPAPASSADTPIDDSGIDDSGIDDSGIDDAGIDDAGIDDEGVDGESGGEANAKVVERADVLLVRFYDYKAERGKAYKYRVKVYLRDPNNPYQPAVGDPRQGNAGQAVAEVEGEPVATAQKFDWSRIGIGHPAVAFSTLANEVIDRVTKDRAQAPPVYWRETEYSDPSPVVYVPTLPLQMLAGGVEPPKVGVLSDGARVVREDSKAKVLSVVWDDNYGTYAPGEIADAIRGTVFNFIGRADMLHPWQYVIKRDANYAFNTGMVLLDMRGGESIGGSKSGLTAPGEILLVDKDGRLIVRNELDDAPAYRRHTFREDAATSVTTTTDSTPAAAPFDPLGSVLD